MFETVIFGAGGHGRVVLDVLVAGNQFKPVGFLDNNPDLHGRRIDGLPVLGDVTQLGALKDRGVTKAVIAIGDNGIRRQMGDALARADFELINAVHPSARLAATASLGRGVVVAAGALVSAHCQIGDYVILNTGCIVDHESMIGTAAHICPGVKLAGHVTVESGAFVGIGATVIQGVRVGFESVVGAGTVVIRDVDPMTSVVGVPARIIKGAPSPDEFASLLQARNHQSRERIEGSARRAGAVSTSPKSVPNPLVRS
ncbi:MAG TPA: acetyltransferase [Phycisphaerae bacterium]|nr:acetyltransferase [Phycisphaerae bacterium]